MKRIFLSFLIVMFLSSAALAELYLIIDSETKEVFTASRKNDTMIPEGKELIVLPGGYENYEFDESITNYKYKNNKFIKNIQKIDELYQKEVEVEEVEIEQELIDEYLKDLAIRALEEEGKSFKHKSKLK